MTKTCWTFANLISLGNALCGMLSIFRSSNHDLLGASLFILGAVLFDFLDGKVARYLAQDSLFGKGMDSLSDVISFGIAPAVLGFSVAQVPPLFMLFALGFFVSAGIWRLAYFIQWSQGHRPPGMPITINGIIFPALFFLHGSTSMFAVVFLISTILMVGPILLSRHPVS